MTKQELILTVILFVLWLESSMLLAMLIDEICMAWKKRKLFKQIRADIRQAINNNFKNELRATRTGGCRFVDKEEANDER